MAQELVKQPSYKAILQRLAILEAAVLKASAPVDAATLGGRSSAFLSSRANHTGAEPANVVTTDSIQDFAVTYAKIQAISQAARVLGRGTISNAVTELQFGAGFSFTGDTINYTPTAATTMRWGNITGNVGDQIDLTEMLSDFNADLSALAINVKSRMPIVSLASFNVFAKDSTEWVSAAAGGTTEALITANTTGINAFLSFLRSNPGTIGYLPAGMYYTNGGHTIYRGSVIWGGGMRTTGFVQHTVLKATTVTFTIQDNGDGNDTQYKNIWLDNFRIDCDVAETQVGSSTGIKITGSPTNPQPIHKLKFSKIWFNNLTYGIDVNSPTGTALQVEDSTVDDCIFVFCRTNYRCNTPNSSIVFNSPFSYMPINGTAFDLISCGYIEINGHNTVTGAPAYSSVTGRATNNTTLIRLTNLFNTVVVNGGQDEAVQNFLVKDGAAHHFGAFIVRDALVQSRVLFNAGMTFLSENNYYVCGITYATFEDAPAAGAAIRSNNDFWENRNEATGVRDFDKHTAEKWSAGSASGFQTRNDRLAEARYNGQYQENKLQPAFANQGRSEPISPAFPATLSADAAVNTRLQAAVLKRPVSLSRSSGAMQPVQEWSEQSGNSLHTCLVFRDNTTGEWCFFSNQAAPNNNFKFGGNITVEQAGGGYIAVSPNGLVRKKIGIDNAGGLLIS